MARPQGRCRLCGDCPPPDGKLEEGYLTGLMAHTLLSLSLFLLWVILFRQGTFELDLALVPGEQGTVVTLVVVGSWATG